MKQVSFLKGLVESDNSNLENAVLCFNNLILTDRFVRYCATGLSLMCALRTDSEWIHPSIDISN